MTHSSSLAVPGCDNAHHINCIVGEGGGFKIALEQRNRSQSNRVKQYTTYFKSDQIFGVLYISTLRLSGQPHTQFLRVMQYNVSILGSIQNLLF